MTRQESRKHHYVPQFLLRPWAIQGTMNGYYWDERKEKLRCNKKGPEAFCNEYDLLALEGQPEYRDEIEQVYGQKIDNKGAVMRDRLLREGPESLNAAERSDFARLMMSLITRKSETINRISPEAVDRGPRMRGRPECSKLPETPLECAKRHGGSYRRDHAVSCLLEFTNEPDIGSKLINFDWHIVNLGEDDGTFVLADQPLVRKAKGYAPLWILPLTPKVAFIIIKRREDIDQAAPREVAKVFNEASVAQAKRYVFCADASHESLLRECLPIPLSDRMDALGLATFGV